MLVCWQQEINYVVKQASRHTKKAPDHRAEQSREGDVVTMVFSLDKYEITTISIDVSCKGCKNTSKD